MDALGKNTSERRLAELTGAQLSLLGALIVVSALFALGLVLGAGFSPWVLVGLPLTMAGCALVVFHSHAALCFAAFSIMPFGVLQAEVIGVTLNLPEFLILALAVKEGLRIVSGQPVFPRHFPVWTVAIFAGCLAAAILTGFYRGNPVLDVLQDFRQFTEYLVLFWLVMRIVGTREQIVEVGFAFVLGGTLIGIHGVIQHFVPVGISETQISSDLVLHHGVRSSSFYGATPLGGLMVLAICPAMGLLIASQHRVRQLLLLGCIGICLLAILFTKTRGSWVGLLVALAFLFYWVRPSRQQALAMALVALVGLVAAGPAIIHRLSTLAEPEEDRSLMERTQYYATAAHIGEAHPVLGLGWGCYYEIDAILQAGEYVRTTPSGEEYAMEEATVHSAYLQIFVKAGALGIVGFLVFMGGWVERIWRVIKSPRGDPSHVAVFAGITAGIVGYLCHSSFENFFQWPVMSQSFWLLVGLSVVAAIPLGGERAYPGAAAAIVSTGAALFVAFVALSLYLETMHTDHFRENVAEALAEGNVREALEIAERAAKLRLADPYAHSVYAEALLENGDRDAAMRQLDFAEGARSLFGGSLLRATGPKFYFAPAHLIRGELHVEAGEYRSALSEFERARAYTDLRDAEFAPYHDMLYAVYARFDFWARALAFGSPDAAAIDAMDPASLQRLAMTCLAEGRWALLEAAGGRLRAMNAYRVVGHFVLGRMHLALNDIESAHVNLQLAAFEGHPGAWYYLGCTRAAMGRPSDAVEAFVRTPADSPYYAVGLAHALAVRGATDVKPDAGASISGSLHQALTALSPTEGESGDGMSLAAFQVPEAAVMPGDSAPLVLLWGTLPDRINAVNLEKQGGNSTVYRLNGGEALLELQWAESLLVSPDVLPAADYPAPMPGWIDGGRDWFDLTPGYGASTQADGGEGREMALPGPSWHYTVPATVREHFGVLTVVELTAPDGAAGLLWHEIDQEIPVPETTVLWESSGAESSSTVAAFKALAPAVDAVQWQILVRNNVTLRVGVFGMYGVTHPVATVNTSAGDSLTANGGAMDRE